MIDWQLSFWLRPISPSVDEIHAMDENVSSTTAEHSSTHVLQGLTDEEAQRSRKAIVTRPPISRLHNGDLPSLWQISWCRNTGFPFFFIGHKMDVSLSFFFSFFHPMASKMDVRVAFLQFSDVKGDVLGECVRNGCCYVR